MSPVPTKKLFRKAWGKFPSGVTVITFHEDDGTVHGLTANAVCSVSLEPFLVLVSVDHKARSFPIMRRSQRFVMNILSKDQAEPSRYFARSDTAGSPPFKFSRSKHGYPVLEDGLAFMDCRIFSTHEAGDHTIFLGEVEEMEVQKGQPLVFYRGKYTQVVEPPG